MIRMQCGPLDNGSPSAGLPYHRRTSSLELTLLTSTRTCITGAGPENRKRSEHCSDRQVACDEKAGDCVQAESLLHPGK